MLGRSMSPAHQRFVAGYQHVNVVLLNIMLEHVSTLACTCVIREIQKHFVHTLDRTHNVNALLLVHRWHLPRRRPSDRVAGHPNYKPVAFGRCPLEQPEVSEVKEIEAPKNQHGASRTMCRFCQTHMTFSPRYSFAIVSSCPNQCNVLTNELMRCHVCLILKILVNRCTCGYPSCYF